jgi:transketolase
VTIYKVISLANELGVDKFVQLVDSKRVVVPTTTTLRASLEVAANIEAILNRYAADGWQLAEDMTQTAEMLVLSRESA